MNKLDTQSFIEELRNFNLKAESYVDRVKAMEKESKELADKYLGKFKVSADCYIWGGCKTVNWDPHIEVNPHPFHKPTPFFHHLDNGEFVWSNSWSPRIYPHTILSLPHPYDTTELLNSCKELSEACGFRVSIKTSILETRLSEDTPCSVDEILLLHPKGVILHKGWIQGSDLLPGFVLVEDPKGYHLYYNDPQKNGGNRRRYNAHLGPKDSYKEFFTMVDRGIRVKGLETLKGILMKNGE